jgi:hypothetical protein
MSLKHTKYNLGFLRLAIRIALPESGTRAGQMGQIGRRFAKMLSKRPLNGQ